MKVHIVQYKWAGSWGPFKIKIPCGECGASEGIIEDVINTEFQKERDQGLITFEVLPWLDTWWKPLLKGGWHAPIVLVNDEMISQGVFVDRDLLAYHIRKELVKGHEAEKDKNIVYSKPGCPHCKKAKELLDKEQIPYEERNIIADPRATHELFYLCKQIFPADKPITVPQIWCKGMYVGDAEAIEKEWEKDGLASIKVK